MMSTSIAKLIHPSMEPWVIRLARQAERSGSKGGLRSAESPPDLRRGRQSSRTCCHARPLVRPRPWRASKHAYLAVAHRDSDLSDRGGRSGRPDLQPHEGGVRHREAYEGDRDQQNEVRRDDQGALVERQRVLEARQPQPLHRTDQHERSRGLAEPGTRCRSGGRRRGPPLRSSTVTTTGWLST